MSIAELAELLPTDLLAGWRTGIAYYRISDDPEHDELGVKRQQRGVREKAERERIHLVAEYMDDDRSAYERKRRPGYEAYLAHAAAVNVAMSWHPDRMTRGDLIEIERLIVALGGDEGTPIVTCETGDYDVSTPHGRMIARITGSVARYASEHNARRLQEKMKELAEAGKVKGGRRAFGYSKDGRHTDPAEAAIIVELVDKLLAGATTYELAAGLNAAGIKTTAGNAWRPGPLRQMLAGTKIAGLATYKGRVMQMQPAADGSLPWNGRSAEWPAIISEDQHRRVVATLDARKPTGRRARTPWLLSGFLRCELCGAALVCNTDSVSTGGARRYQCRKGPGYSGCGKVRIKAEPVEELLGALVSERLADTDARRGADSGPDDSAELAELDRIAAQRIEVADDAASGELSRAGANDRLAGLDRLQRAVEGRLAGKVRQTVPLDFVAAAGFIGRPWTELALGDQRLILGALIDHVSVAPASAPGSTKFEPGRITAPGRIVWKA